MKYMMMNYRDEAAAANMTKEEQMQERQEYNAFFENASQRVTIISGEGVHPTSAATTIRVRDVAREGSVEIRLVVTFE